MRFRTGKAILRVHINAILRHAVVKHDPNAGRRVPPRQRDRTRGRIPNHFHQNNRRNKRRDQIHGKTADPKDQNSGTQGMLQLLRWAVYFDHDCNVINPRYPTVQDGAIGCDYFLQCVLPLDPELN